MRKAPNSYRKVVPVAAGVVIASAVLVIVIAAGFRALIEAIDLTSAQLSMMEGGSLEAPPGSVVIFQGDSVATVVAIAGVKGGPFGDDSLMLYRADWIHSNDRGEELSRHTLEGFIEPITDWSAPIVIRLEERREKVACKHGSLIISADGPEFQVVTECRSSEFNRFDRKR
jgi:hypothetical protein